MTYEDLMAEIDAAMFFAHQAGELGESLATESLMLRRDTVRVELRKLFEAAGRDEKP